MPASHSKPMAAFFVADDAELISLVSHEGDRVSQLTLA